MLSRLKRRSPSSHSAAEHDSAEYTQDYIDQAHSIAAQGGHLDPNSLSPSSTRSRGQTTSSGSSQAAARTLSPSRAQGNGKGGRASRSSSFGSFVDRPDVREGGRYIAVREGGLSGGDDIGAGSLTLDHLDGPALGERSATVLARAPELMINTAVPPPTEGNTQSRDSASSVESTTQLRTPMPGAEGQDQYFSSNGYARSRSNTTNEPPSSASLNGLRALAGLNGSPGITPSYPSSSSLDPESANSVSGSHSRPSSRPISRSSSIRSQQRPNADSLRPPVSTSPVQSKPILKKQRSGQGIAGALALSGAALAGAHVRTAAASVGGVGEGIMGRDSTDSMEGDGRSEYGGEANASLVSVDGMGDFDDVVSQLGTGYAVASSKRNAEFHAIFKSIPDDDYLIEDYGCALQREILIQGRLYISEHHLSFNANIFGWVTTLTLPFAEVVSIEKRMTAYVIPNAIQVTTMHARHTFASFLSRDTTYDLIGSIWRMVHPVVPTSAALPDSNYAHGHHESEDEHDKYDVDGGSLDGHEDESTGKEKPRKKRLRGLRRRGDTGASADSKGRGRANTGESMNGAAVGGGAGTASTGSPRGGNERKVHPATVDTCPTLKNLKEVCMDSIFPSAPEKIYNLMFTSGFMKDFWSENQKLLELQISDWAPEKSGSNLLARSMSYIKPLNGAIGPKQTKCLITDESAHVDFDDFVCVITTTRTPDVPSGSVFSVKTRTSLTWAKGNSCRVVVTTGVEWTGRSFVKGIIERSCIDGQKTYHSDLEKAMRAYIQQHRSEFLEEGQEVDAQSVAETASLTENNDRHANGSADAVDSSPRGEEQGGLIMALLRGVGGALSDLVGGLSPTSAGLAFVVLVLVLSNLWTLASRPSTPSRSSSRSPPMRAGSDRTPDQVALAVRDVLRDYFADPAAVKVATPGPSAVGDPSAEVAEIRAVLDGLEERIARLRGALEEVE